MTKIRHGGASYTTLDNRYYTKAQLGSTTVPSGASLIGIADAGGFFASTNVETALQELAGVILPGQYLRLDGTNVPTANYNWTTNLVTTGTLQGGTITDGTVSFTAGVGTGLVSLTDGTASWAGSNLSGFGTIQANTSVTASTLTIAGGLITDTTGTISFGNENLTTIGTITGNSLTDGTATLTGGALTGLSSVAVTTGAVTLTITGNGWSSSDGTSLTTDALSVGSLSSGLIIGSDLIITGEAGIGGVTTAGTRLKITTDANDLYGIYIDRTTTDFTTSGTEPYNVYADLGVNWGTGNIGYCRSFSNRVTMSNTDAVIDADKYWYLFYNYLDVGGKITNTGATDRTLYIRNQQMWTDDDGSYDTDSTGEIHIESRGVYVDLDSNPVFYDTGGNAPQNEYRTYGVDINIDSNPILNDSALLTQEVRMITMSGSITTEGGLYNRIYGIYISALNGGWRQYGIYNNDSDLTYFIWSEGGDIALDKDDNKIIWGEGQDGSMYWTTEGDDHLKIDPQEAAVGHYLVINVPKTTTGDPANPVEGLIYWNTVDNVLNMYCDGGWRTLASW